MIIACKKEVWHWFHVRRSNTIFFSIELRPHIVGEAFYTGEVENEIRHMLQENPGTTLLQFRFKTDSDREEMMKTIESIRVTSTYPHPPEECTPECKERGRLMQE